MVVRGRVPSNTFPLAMATLAAALSVEACWLDPPPPRPAPSDVEPVGSVGLALMLPDGTAISAIHFSLRDAAGIEIRQGDINVTDPQATVSAVIGAVPAADGYTILLTSLLAIGSACSGVSDPFSVAIEATTSVTVLLLCRTSGEGGTVVVGGVMDSCPVLASYSASPLSVSPGGAIDVSAVGNDADPGDVLSYAWTATAGTFDSPGAPATTYRCPLAGGAQMLVVSVADGFIPGSTPPQPRCSAGISLIVDCGTPTGSAFISCAACEDHFCAPQGLGCGTLAGATRTACEVAVSCMRGSHCAIGGDASFCYCGTASQDSDSGCARQPLGPCIAALEAADPHILATDNTRQRFMKIAADLNDAATPIGKATGLIGCDAFSCDTPTTCAGQF